MNTVDALLFDKLDVIHRLTTAFEETEERFWKQLGRTTGAVIKELVDPKIVEIFSRASYWNDGCGCAYRNEWLLDFSSAGEKVENYLRAPGFWFPHDHDAFNLLGLAGLDMDCVVYAAIWGQPLSRYSGDLPSARALMEKLILGPLEAKGWEPYGVKVTKPLGEWGIRIPIRLDHHTIAKAMESGDLRPALTPLEGAIEDFKAVYTAMDEVINILLKKKKPPKQRTPL